MNDEARQLVHCHTKEAGVLEFCIDRDRSGPLTSRDDLFADNSKPWRFHLQGKCIEQDVVPEQLKPLVELLTSPEYRVTRFTIVGYKVELAIDLSAFPTENFSRKVQRIMTDILRGNAALQAA